MPELAVPLELDFTSETYKSAYSRINAIVIEGEYEANSNYIQLADILTDNKEELHRLAKMENRHMISSLHDNFQIAYAEGKVVTCLLIQSLIIEAFAIAAYNIYIPVADPFARKITESVVKDEYLHLNFGEEWLKANFETAKEELEAANRANLPIVWRMLNQVEDDARVLAMEKEALVEDFMISYGEALSNIGFSTRDIMRMSAYGLTAV